MHSLFAAQAAAQAPGTGTTATTADDRSTAFRPVESGGELQSGEKLLVEAYAAVWILVFTLILLSWRRQRQIDRRVSALEAALEKARAGADQGAD